MVTVGENKCSRAPDGLNEVRRHEKTLCTRLFYTTNVKRENRKWISKTIRVKRLPDIITQEIKKKNDKSRHNDKRFKMQYKDIWKEAQDFVDNLREDRIYHIFK